MADLSDWKPRARPSKDDSLEGRYARLEPLNVAKHFDDLLAANEYAHENGRLLLSLESPPSGAKPFREWMEMIQAKEDPFFFAIIDKATGKVSDSSRTELKDMMNAGCNAKPKIILGHSCVHSPTE